METAYQFTKNKHHRRHDGSGDGPQVVPVLMTLFLFIWWSNMIGYLPLPTNTEHPVELFGIEVPRWRCYAATANLSVPLVLALVVWVIYHYEGIKEHGPIGYVKSWIPPERRLAPALHVLHRAARSARAPRLARCASLRQRARRAPPAPLMAGGLAVILGFAAIGLVTLPLAVAFPLRGGLVATLQAFIFASLAATYIGGAVSHDH